MQRLAVAVMAAILVFAGVDAEKATDPGQRPPSMMRNGIDAVLDSVVTSIVFDAAITNLVEQSRPYKNVMRYLVEQGANFHPDPDLCQGLEPDGQVCAVRRFWEWVQFTTKEPGWFARLWEVAFKEKSDQPDPPTYTLGRAARMLVRADPVAISRKRMEKAKSTFIRPAIGTVGSVSVIEAIRAASHAVAPGPGGVLAVPRKAAQGAVSGSMRAIQTMLVRFIIGSILQPNIELLLSDHDGNEEAMVNAVDRVLPDGPLVKAVKTLLIRKGLKKLAPPAATLLATHFVNRIVTRLFRLLPEVRAGHLTSLVKAALWTGTVAVVVGGASQAIKAAAPEEEPIPDVAETPNTGARSSWSLLVCASLVALTSLI
ncbi:Uncharacterized protein PBTT_04376 [Plasmodiophora brassicae]|uniref:Uncharacterized protein n=1 Tax=Plasmodiophora brassicae TaxID=37360 RepID=A0A0G4IGR2_PLABS|nr:hypothetical protein PBRA_000042 [Plasmodiophora brassicae]SPQ96618.1 unnamed protein product [Plasmodiophora brassicae]